MSGVTRQSYAPEIRIIRLMCTGRVDLAFILRAFANRADGVIIGGCWPGECHYVTEGNYDALGNVHLCRRLLAHLGLAAERLRLEWIAASEGGRFAEVMTEFVARVRELGPIGVGEGLGEGELERKLAAATGLVPWLKLVEREKLRVPVKSEAAYAELWEGESARRVLAEITDKLALSQIMALLAERPATTAELAERLGLAPTEVSRHLGASSRHGLVRYDLEGHRYALA